MNEKATCETCRHSTGHPTGALLCVIEPPECIDPIRPLRPESWAYPCVTGALPCSHHAPRIEAHALPVVAHTPGPLTTREGQRKGRR
jgi:hypothetical protein